MASTSSAVAKLLKVTDEKPNLCFTGFIQKCRCDFLSTQIKFRDEAIATLREEKSKLINEQSKSYDETVKVQNDNYRLKSRNRELFTANKSMTEDIKIITDECTLYKKRYSDSISKVNELSAQIKIKDEQITALMGKEQELSEAITAKDEQIAGTKRKYQELSDVVKTRDEELSELNEKIKKLEQQNLELTQGNEQLNIEKGKIFCNLSYVNGQIHEKNIQITNYKNDINELQEKIKEISTECDVRTIDLRYALQHINQLKQMIEQHNTQIATFSNTKQSEIDKLKEENEAFKKQINWLQLQIVSNDFDEPPRKKRRI